MADATQTDPNFEALLDYLKHSRGFDFTGYKRTSLMRRVHKRMMLIDISDFAEYVDYLEVHPDEFSQLFNTILINVTSFFRDADSWDYLYNQIIPKIISTGKEPIRVWSAGCASGQEAYSIAILLCEALGQPQFHERVKIYATDVDEEALTQARQATYDVNDLADIPDNLKEKYFAISGQRCSFRSDLRRLVIFGRHDLLQDAPISHLSLLLCRNTLMYLNAETQSRILARFHFGLDDGGYLFLGKAEMLLSHASLFNQVDPRHRIFTKVSKLTIRDQLLILAQAGTGESATDLREPDRLRDIAFDASLMAQITVAENGCLSLANEAARMAFGITYTDIGRPLQDLEISYKPIELRSLVEQAVADRRNIKVGNVVRTLNTGDIQRWEIYVIPLFRSGDKCIGSTIIFNDITVSNQLYEELQSAHEELETTNEELQSTNEELETTNEELQSTNEELETTNEELQSTNEELETTNEELQSANEELESTSQDLQSLMADVSISSTSLSNILSGIRHAVIVVDTDSKILAWNNRSENMWGVRSDEAIGNDLNQLDIGLPLDPIKESFEKMLGGDDLQEFDVSAVNRRGREFTCRVITSPLTLGGLQKQGAVFLLSESNKQIGEQ